MLFWPGLIIGLAILALLLSEPSTDSITAGGRTDMRVAYLVVLAAALTIFGAGRMLVRGGRRTLVHTAIWLGAITGVLTAFAFRDQATVIVREIRAELMPSVALSRAAGEAELHRAWDGHYRATAEVNGIKMRLMVDTGATMVLIPFEQAAEIGIDPDSLDFSMPVTTANGRSSVAPIRLSSIKIGPIAVFDVPAAVTRPGRLKTGLLGMSFLDRLAETSFQGDRLILRQHIPGQRDHLRSIPTGN
jgi:aspartyl protease family protein